MLGTPFRILIGREREGATPISLLSWPVKGSRFAQVDFELKFRLRGDFI